jgi:hypothetical protein
MHCGSKQQQTHWLIMQQQLLLQCHTCSNNNVLSVSLPAQVWAQAQVLAPLPA